MVPLLCGKIAVYFWLLMMPKASRNSNGSGKSSKDSKKTLNSCIPSRNLDKYYFLNRLLIVYILVKKNGQTQK